MGLAFEVINVKDTRELSYLKEIAAKGRIYIVKKEHYSNMSNVLFFLLTLSRKLKITSV